MREERFDIYIFLTFTKIMPKETWTEMMNIEYIVARHVVMIGMSKMGEGSDI